MPGPYQLFIIRHAVAEERGDAWPDDAKRPLSEDGASRMRKAARGLDRLGVTLEVVVTSPLVRAKQTAEIVAAAMNPRPPIVSIESLTPDGTFQDIIADLEKQAKRSRIAIVGHEPGIGEFAARLIGSRHSIEFKKGAICRIDVDALPPSGPGDLRWMLTTKILRSIRK
jgi:phosphohistidine phosphatase